MKTYFTKLFHLRITFLNINDSVFNLTFSNSTFRNENINGTIYFKRKIYIMKFKAHFSLSFPPLIIQHPEAALTH